ncbi:MAG TPA: lysophospholipid acyltransferase family protein [Polyangiales bacterium]|nr:lysophospholipid acyltransferase family protein [Polyangiales bacterium]
MASESEVASAAASRHGLRTWISTLLFWPYLLISSMVLFVGALLLFAATVAFDRRRALLHLYTCAWAYHYVRLLPLWRARFIDRERIAGGRTYVLVANHQSLGDILVLFGLFKHYKWVSKRAIFRVPFIGWNMMLNDYVGLLRGDPKSIEKMMQECRVHLRRGSSVMMFPEGTRSTDGEIKSFKHGAFTLASELGLALVPIVIDGTRDALPKHGLMLDHPWGLDIRVRVLDPIEPRADEPVAELSTRVREVMVAELAAMRAVRAPD